MQVLGIGRNMVKSLQFWCEAMGVLTAAPGGGHVPGPIGLKLLDPVSGWDPYLESVESLWLLHWQLSTGAALAAWAEVFAEDRLSRFDRQQLIAALGRRAAGAARPLASSTLDQHAAIFLQSYHQAERSGDDTSWCPLQDLSLLRAVKNDDGRVVFSAERRAPLGLSLRVFAIALIEFIDLTDPSASSVAFSQILNGANSPGVVFRIDEPELRMFIENLVQGPLRAALRFVDTADTQSIVLDRALIDPAYLLAPREELCTHA
jgi:hypothetical protein